MGNKTSPGPPAFRHLRQEGIMLDEPQAVNQNTLLTVEFLLHWPVQFKTCSARKKWPSKFGGGLKMELYLC